MNIGEVIGWKFNNEPGMCTEGGRITKWPASLGPMPTDKQLAEWTAEYEGRPVEVRMDKADALRAELEAKGVLVKER